MQKKTKIKSNVCNSNIILSSRFLLWRNWLLFLSNFFKYSSSNLPSSHSYNIFIIYFFGNFSLLKSLSSAISSFFCFLTSAFNLFSNSTTTSFVFSKSSSLSQLLCSTVNPFHYTKYFVTPFIFLLFNILSTSHFSTPSTFISFTSFFFCPSTCFLYYTTRLIFTTG